MNAASASQKTPEIFPSSSRSEVEQQFRDIIDRANQETEENQQKISGAKDKAQLSTTGSLSLTLIIVLKQLLEDVTSGRGSTMIYISFFLVLLCLVFQTAIAFLAIYIYSKNKTAPVFNKESPPSMKTYKSTAYSENLFKTDHETQQELHEGKQMSGHVGEEQTTLIREESPVTAHIFQLFRDLDSSDSKQPWYAAFLPCLRLSQQDIDEKYTFHDAAKRLHDILTVEKLKATFEFTEAQFYASCNIDNEGSSNKEEITSRKENLESKRNKLNTLTTQFKLLDLQLDLFWRRKAFADIFRLQKTLTYLTYVVFILNSFITGFGLTKQ